MSRQRGYRKALMKAAREGGWTVSKGKHYKMTHPGVAGVVTAPITPSDRRGLQSVLADMKRALRMGVSGGAVAQFPTVQDALAKGRKR